MRVIRAVLLLFSINLGFSQDNFETKGVLPDPVLETSGLIYYNGGLITLNDSGNSAELFELDTLSLAIKRTVIIEGVTNTDWEDLAQDDTYIYIGDFGNNVGSRTDLKIYRVQKSDYTTGASVPVETISFSYVDQSDFSGGQNSDFDAEAMIVYNDQILIFTKQWQTNGTVAYAIPKVPGDYIAQPVAQYNSNGLITGAEFDTTNNVLMLCGYSQQLQPFVIHTTGLNTDFDFNASTTKYALSLGFAQIEGVGLAENGRYFLSSEKFVNANPPVTLESSLYAFNFMKEPDPGPDPDPNPNPDPDPDPDPGPDDEPYREGVTLFKPQGSERVHYELFGDRQLFGRAIFDTSGRMIRYYNIQEIEGTEVDLTGLGTGVYYLTFYLRGLTLSEPFVVQ